MSGRPRARQRTVEVPCTVDIGYAADTLHAHVVLDGIEPGPGDQVIVHDAPAAPAWGERIVCRRTATVVRAGFLARLRARIAGAVGLAELYEV